MAALRARGIEVVMATGDRRETANFVAKELGLTEVYAETAAGRQIASGIGDEIARPQRLRSPATA